jgi:hypothetical protein
MKRRVFLTDEQGNLLGEMEVDKIEPWQGTQRYLGELVWSRFPEALAAALREQEEVINTNSMGVLDDAERAVAVFRTCMADAPDGPVELVRQFEVYEDGGCSFICPARDYDRMLPCACCGYITIRAWPPGSAHYCPICFWISETPGERPTSLNKTDLATARELYRKQGVVQLQFKPRTRPPKPEEIPE